MSSSEFECCQLNAPPISWNIKSHQASTQTSAHSHIYHPVLNGCNERRMYYQTIDARMFVLFIIPPHLIASSLTLGPMHLAPCVPHRRSSCIKSSCAASTGTPHSPGSASAPAIGGCFLAPHPHQYHRHAKNTSKPACPMARFLSKFSNTQSSSSGLFLNSGYILFPQTLL